eukprot:1159279-Pelagomonas_calceolata.AAC.13
MWLVQKTRGKTHLCLEDLDELQLSTPLDLKPLGMTGGKVNEGSAQHSAPHASSHEIGLGRSKPQFLHWHTASTGNWGVNSQFKCINELYDTHMHMQRSAAGITFSSAKDPSSLKTA